MQESCIPCKHFKQLGSRYFCYLKGSFLESPNSRCREFSLKVEEDSKKRVFFTDEEESGGKRREEIEVVVKPPGSEEFRLKKELTKLAPKEFHDKEIKKEETEERETKSYAVAVLLVLLLVLLLLLLSRARL